jgi:NAD(P)-dependent dehydrogenase (short-subunit alcohol dehydrogenase family)
VFFDALANQVSDRRVTVACVQPGVMDTGMQASIRQAAAGGGWFPDGDRFVRLHEQGELPGPAEVARRIIAEHLSEVTVQ